MADGVSVTPGAGATIATDEKNYGSGLVQVQLIGIADARDGQTGLAGVDANGNLMVYVSGLKTAIKVTPVDLVQNATAVNPTGTPLTGRSSVLIYNESDVTIRLGSASTVTASGTTRGIPIPSGQSYSVDLGAVPFFLYAPTGGAGGTKPVNILEIA